jgi:hypothetical protein
MNSAPVGQIEVISRADEDESRSDKVRLVSQALDISELREQFKKFMSSLQSIIDTPDSDATPFQLAEIEFSAEITGSGDFKLLGTGIGVEASTAVKFVLQRRHTAQ